MTAVNLPPSTAAEAGPSMSERTSDTVGLGDMYTVLHYTSFTWLQSRISSLTSLRHPTPISLSSSSPNLGQRASDTVSSSWQPLKTLVNAHFPICFVVGKQRVETIEGRQQRARGKRPVSSWYHRSTVLWSASTTV